MCVWAGGFIFVLQTVDGTQTADVDSHWDHFCRSPTRLPPHIHHSEHTYLMTSFFFSLFDEIWRVSFVFSSTLCASVGFPFLYHCTHARINVTISIYIHFSRADQSNHKQLTIFFLASCCGASYWSHAAHQVPWGQLPDFSYFLCHIFLLFHHIL